MLVLLLIKQSYQVTNKQTQLAWTIVWWLKCFATGDNVDICTEVQLLIPIPLE